VFEKKAQFDTEFINFNPDTPPKQQPNDKNAQEEFKKFQTRTIKLQKQVDKLQ